MEKAEKTTCILEVCCSASCRINGSEELRARLKEVLGIHVGEKTKDGRFAIKEAPCFGACDASPSVRVNGTIYGPLKTTEDVRKMLEEVE